MIIMLSKVILVVDILLFNLIIFEMTHIYAVKRSDVEHEVKRQQHINNIAFLRKFEGKQLVEERISDEMSSLHKLWFGKSGNNGVPKS